MAIAKIKYLADLAGVLEIRYIKDKLKVEFNLESSKHLQGPNIFKALEHVNMKASVALTEQQHLTVLLTKGVIKRRVLFNELETFLTDAGELVDK